MKTPVEPNRMAARIARMDIWPGPLRRWALTRIARASVPYVGTTGIDVETITPGLVRLNLRNRRRARNHIGGVHAAAIALLAETASGFVFAMNLPDGKLPLLKTMHLDYVERARGDLVAEARFDSGKAGEMQAERGEMPIIVRVWSEDGTEPVECTMHWAWVPSRR